jgi:hypothetical protein
MKCPDLSHTCEHPDKCGPGYCANGNVIEPGMRHHASTMKEAGFIVVRYEFDNMLGSFGPFADADAAMTWIASRHVDDAGFNYDVVPLYTPLVTV